jgi:hypothetical protein
MLQRAASNAYSWWWASHIRTSQSKWLDATLHGTAFIRHLLSCCSEPRIAIAAL